MYLNPDKAGSNEANPIDESRINPIEKMDKLYENLLKWKNELKNELKKN